MMIRMFVSCAAAAVFSLAAFAVEFSAFAVDRAPSEPAKTEPVKTGPAKPDAQKPAATKQQAVKKEAPVVPPRAGKSETIQLFNGKNLDGWVGHAQYWSVQDGAIVGKSDEPVKVSTYLLTKRSFTDFRLLATVKLGKHEIHSGIAFWGRIAPEHGDEYTYAGHLVMFPMGWGLYDLFGRNGLRVDTKPARKVGKQHDWNELEILAQGNRIREVVNGALVMDWRDPEPERIKEGPIGLQLHDEMPQEVEFKNLVLTTFPEDKLITLKEVTETPKKE